jgi:hypothetical protein
MECFIIIFIIFFGISFLSFLMERTPWCLVPLGVTILLISWLVIATNLDRPLIKDTYHEIKLLTYPNGFQKQIIMIDETNMIDVAKLANGMYVPPNYLVEERIWAGYRLGIYHTTYADFRLIKQ